MSENQDPQRQEQMPYQIEIRNRIADDRWSQCIAFSWPLVTREGLILVSRSPRNGKSTVQDTLRAMEKYL